MFPGLEGCGGIEDVGCGLRWESDVLAGEVARRAAILARRGVRPGTVVAISHSGSAYFFADLLAVWSVGAAAACLDGALTDRELENVLGFLKPAILLVDRSKTSSPAVKTSPAAGIPILEMVQERRTGGPAAEASAAATDHDPEAPALILFTSGTTGTPKGVVLTYRAVQMRIAFNVAAIGRPALRRTLVTLPTHFGHGLIGNALTPLMNGGDIVLYAPGALGGEDLGRVIDRHGITFLSSVPALWNMALRRGAPPAGGSLLRVHVGSAPLSAKLWSQIAEWSRAEVVNCLGMTETANWIAGASSRADGIVDGLVGKPWGGEAGVLDGHGAIKPTGAGEIVVRSPCVTAGYFNRPDLTAAVMVDGWFRTGDSGAVDELGRIRLTGRIKDEINRAGFKVQPAEIDLVIEAHPAVAEACVFGIPDPVSGEVVGAAVRLVDRAAADAGSLDAWCGERLRRVAVPERWFIVDVIPRNVRGKVNRDAVRRQLTETAGMAADGETRLAAVPAGGALRRANIGRAGGAVERAWTSVLGRRSFRNDMPWDKAGGDSLGAMRLWLQIEQQLAMALPLDRLKFNITPSELIALIEKLVETAGQGAEIVSLHTQPPPVFLMPPAHGDTPALAQFRAAFNTGVRFEVIRYPALEEFLDGGAGFDLLVDAAVAQIRARGRRDAYYLAGYSFGGYVAWEVARRLRGSGHEIRFLGLIDAQLVRVPRERWNILQKALRCVQKIFHPRQDKATRRTLLAAVRASGASAWGAWLAAVEDVRASTVRTLTRRCPWPLLRRVDRIAGALPGAAAVGFRWELMAQLRGDALKPQAIRPLDVAATLFRSEELLDSNPDYGWGSICSQLKVVLVPGDHLSLFEAGNREMFCSLFAQSVEAARAAAPAAMSKTGS
jgi:oxalate---CoA ligase